MWLQVVPFTPTAGLLAWVEHTMPLNNYLVGCSALLAEIEHLPDIYGCQISLGCLST